VGPVVVINEVHGIMRGHKWFPTFRKPQGKVTLCGPAAKRWSTSKRTALDPTGKSWKRAREQGGLDGKSRKPKVVWSAFFKASNAFSCLVKNQGSANNSQHTVSFCSLGSRHFDSGSNALEPVD
jgi:hypothetical protein